MTEEEGSEFYDSSQEFITKAVEPLIGRVIQSTNLTGNITTTLSKEGRVRLQGELKHESGRPIRVEFSSSLLQILGFTRAQLTEERAFQTTITGELKTPLSHFDVKLSRGISSLWVYTDVIRGHVTGHSITPLLRVIPIDPTLNNDASRVLQFEKPYYFPVNLDEIQRITIQIYNAGGKENLTFATPVVCKLHFRKRVL